MKLIEIYKGVEIKFCGRYEMFTTKPIYDTKWFGWDNSIRNCRKRIDEFMRRNKIKDMSEWSNGYSC